MMMTTLGDLASQFRRMHDRDGGRPLVLPNAWDAMSARLIEEAGARAIATTSSGVSWSLGRPDGHGLTRDEMLGAVRRIATTVRVPVTADVEGGYGDETPNDVADTVRGVLDAGAVGVNIEDTRRRSGPALFDVTEQVERLRAARESADAVGVPIFINARVDAYVRHPGASEARLAEVVRRAQAYIAAGADSIFVLGATDAATIARLVAEIDAPLNILAGPDSLTVDALASLGVARVSLGGAITEAVMGFVRRTAMELLTDGTYDSLREPVTYAEANALFARASVS